MRVWSGGFPIAAGWSGGGPWVRGILRTPPQPRGRRTWMYGTQEIPARGVMRCSLARGC